MPDHQEFDCREAFKRLDDFVDRELSAEEMDCVRRHLQRCKECAEEFRFESALIEGLKQKLAHIDLPPDLLAKVRAALDEH